MTFVVDPFSEREGRFGMKWIMTIVSLSSIGLFGAAMLAEPAVPQVEEVSGLVHQGTDLRSQI